MNSSRKMDRGGHAASLRYPGDVPGSTLERADASHGVPQLRLRSEVSDPLEERADRRSEHVLMLVENLPVPFDRRAWMEATALRRAGYRVTVISPAPDDEPAGFREIEGIRLHRYAPPAPARGKLSFLREYTYCTWQTRRLVRRVWRQERFDAIHTCNPPDLFWAIARAYKRHGVRFVFDHHDVCPELYLSKFNRRDVFYHGLCWCERRQFATADAVISTNESYRRIALERGGKRPEDVTIVRSGPSLARFLRTPVDPDLKRGRAHLAVYLGVMGPQDGVDYALHAVRHARDEGLNDTTFAFIGDGDCRADLQRLALRLGVDDLVTFTGRVADETLRRYLCTADLALAPDPRNPLNDISTMNKIVEYMAMSLPVISFDLIESRFTAGQAATYVPDNDTRLMGRTIIELLADPQRRERMGRLGRARVETMMAWEHSEQYLIELYDRLFGHAGEAPALPAPGDRAAFVAPRKARAPRKAA